MSNAEKRAEHIENIKKLITDPDIPKDELNELIDYLLDSVPTKYLAHIDSMRVAHWSQM